MPNIDNLDPPALIRVLRKCDKIATRLLWMETPKTYQWEAVYARLANTSYDIQKRLTKLLEARAYVPLTDEIDY